MRWTVLGLFLAAAVWTFASHNPFAQGVQGLLGRPHDETIIDRSFVVPARAFRYYKFVLPTGSAHSSVAGSFSTSEGGDDSGIEVYVLNEETFAAWQKGDMASGIYQSGRVSQGKVQSDLPAGAGVYYVVFSNKFSTVASKRVRADLAVHPKSWWQR